MERPVFLYVLLFVFVEMNCREIMKDSLVVDIPHEGVIVENKDTAIYDSGVSVLPEVLVYGINKAKRNRPRQSNIDMQLLGIHPDDMNFRPLGLIRKIYRFFFKKKHKETDKERIRRLLNEYDAALPLIEK